MHECVRTLLKLKFNQNWTWSQTVNMSIYNTCWVIMHEVSTRIVEHVQAYVVEMIILSYMPKLLFY